MITNFEKETHELNDYERDVLLPLLVKGLRTKVGKENAVTNKQICNALKEQGYKLNDARVRKLVQYIRVNHIVPLVIATSKGYYIATSKDEVEKYITSLTERLNAIKETRNAIIKQLTGENVNPEENFRIFTQAY